MNSSVNHHSGTESFIKDFRSRLTRNLDKAAIYLSNVIVQSFGSAPRQPKYLGKKATLEAQLKFGFRKRPTKAWRRANSSAPGDPPNVQTGTMKRSIAWESPSDLHRKVGSTIKPRPDQSLSYPLMLELGTIKMSPRPWLLPGYKKAKPVLRLLVVEGNIPIKRRKV